MRVVELQDVVPDDEPAVVRQVWFTPTGRGLVAAVGGVNRSHALVGYDLAADREAWRARADDDGDDGRVRNMLWPDPAVCPAAGLFAGWGWDPRDRTESVAVRRWDTYELVARLRHPGGLAASLAFTPDGRFVLAAVWEGRTKSAVVRWPAAPAADGGVTPPDGWRLVPGEPVAVSPPAVSADGRRVAAGSRAGAAAVWDFATAAPVATLRLPADAQAWRKPVGPVAVSADGTRVAGGSWRAVFLWDVPNPRPRWAADLPGDAADVAFTPDDRRVVVAAGDAAVVLDADTGAVVRRLGWAAGPMCCAAVAPDGLTAAVGGAGGRVVLWDLDD